MLITILGTLYFRAGGYFDLNRKTSSFDKSEYNVSNFVYLQTETTIKDEHFQQSKQGLVSEI